MYVNHTTTITDMADGKTAVSSETRPCGQDSTAINHANSGGLLW